MSTASLSSTSYQPPPETNDGVVTSWIPITTAYPSISGCDQSFWSYVPSTLAAWDPGYGISVDTALKCWPQGATTWFDIDRLGPNTATVMSLGPMTCPQAYSTMATSVKDAFSTFVACCPSGYSYDNKPIGPGGTGQCTSEVAPGDYVTYATRSGGNWVTSTTTVTSSTTVAAIQFNGWILAEETATASPSSSPSVASPTSTSPDLSSGSGGGSGGLTTGAKAGIGVGVAVGVLLLAGLFAMPVIARKRRNKREGDRSSEPFRGYYDPTGNMDRKPVQEADHAEPKLAEINSHERPQEVPSNRDAAIYEMR